MEIKNSTSKTAFTRKRSETLQAMTFYAICACLTLFAPFVAKAQTAPFITHKNSHHKFSLEYPETFSRVPSKERGSTVLVVQNLRSGFPLITVAKRRGEYENSSEAKHEYKILDEYRRRGYTDVRLVNTFTGKFRYMPKQRNVVRVSYSVHGRKMYSDVIYVSGRNSHFVLTFMDYALEYPSHTMMRQRLLSSFTLDRYHFVDYVRKTGGSSANNGTRRNAPSNSRPPVAAALLLVTAIILGAATIFRQDGDAGSSGGGGGDKKAGNE